LKVNYSGCAICDSTWGNLHEEVDGTSLFFCCPVCAAQFRNLVGRIKSETGWTALDTLTISGDRRGRTCHAARGNATYACRVAFNAQGEIRTFVPQVRSTRSG
jgi:Ta0938